MSLSVGQKIELNDGRHATIRFVGNTSFQTGEWVGVELEEGTGKNDGSVQGERYFDCEQGFGMFLRPAGVRQIIDEAKPKAKTTSNGIAGSAKPTSVKTTAPNGAKRHSVIAGTTTKRLSTLASSPTPGSAARSPTKQLGSNGVSSTSTSRTSTPPVSRRPASVIAAKPRSSMLPPSATPNRRTSTLPGALAPSSSSRPSRLSPVPSTVGSRTAAARGVAARPPSGRSSPPARTNLRPRLGSSQDDDTSDMSSQQSNTQSPRSGTGASAASQPDQADDEEDRDDTVKMNFAPPPVPPIPQDPPSQQTRPRRPSSPTGASVHSQRTLRSSQASARQIEELEAKIRLLERKRMEDRDIKKTLEQAQQERDQYKGIIEKLQQKYRPQQAELTELKKALSEAETKAASIATLEAEHESVFELATIDREMAEERAQGLEEQLEALRTQNDEMELELEILREENGELSKEMSPEERAGAGWMQMEKSNERLREALLRLRDITQDKEAEFKEQIRSLEDQVKESETVKTAFQEMKEKALRSEADTNELRQQLEVAEESEEMIEQLSEQKTNLEDRIHQLRNTIEELEELRELNDELVVNHQEDEKQMQEEIDFKDSLLMDRERTAKQQQEAIDEADYTISRYRTLVSELQSGLQEMQASKQLSETEAADLNNKSRAMLDLNLKLQSSAAKTQVKTIDLELRKLDAQEASEHLAIVQLFLPEAFHSERDSVLALLRFKRIGFKASLVHAFVKERIASFGARGQEEDVFAACDVLDKLIWIATMSERFVNSIRGCSVEDFAGYEGALHELEPVERALNSYIDGLRREELRESDVAEELQRSIAVMSHLASIHIKSDLASHADELLMRTQCLQSQLESAASALGLTRSMVDSNVKSSPGDEEDEDEDDDGSISDLALILSRAEALTLQVRSAKVVAGKTHRSLVDLEIRHLTLDASCTEHFDSVEAVVTQIASYTRQAGMALQALFGEEGRSEPLGPSEISGVLARIATAVFSLPSAEAGPFFTLAGRLRELTDLLSDLASLPMDLDNTVEFERAPEPWVARSNELKQTKLTSIDVEAQLARALESLKERDITVQDRGRELEEQSVRIEMLEARMKEASKRSAKIAELERALHEAIDGEKKAKADLARARQDASRNADKARDEMSRLAEQHSRSGSGRHLDDGAMGAGVRLAVARQEHQIARLEGAVRFLQDENYRLRLPAPDSPLSLRATHGWLHGPLAPAAPASRKRAAAMQRAGDDLLRQMLHLAAAPQIVDLTKLPENKLAWRPARETPRWKVEKRKEEWARWKDASEDILLRTRRQAAMREVTKLPSTSEATTAPSGKGAIGGGDLVESRSVVA